MSIKGGGISFKEKYYHFVSKNTKGKIMFLESYKGKIEEVEWGKGAVLILKKANPFLLNIVKDWFLEKPTRLAGDIAGLLIQTVRPGYQIHRAIPQKPGRISQTLLFEQKSSRNRCSYPNQHKGLNPVHEADQYSIQQKFRLLA